jgi:hypothetical protein
MHSAVEANSKVRCNKNKIQHQKIVSKRTDGKNFPQFVVPKQLLILLHAHHTIVIV